MIIDQPEENLDPKSIFVELVGRFVETRRRRQIIIVTHNANLVVNTDADQVIVASSGAHVPGGLPRLSYVSGGLENPKVRDEVCEILEGGKQPSRSALDDCVSNSHRSSLDSDHAARARQQLDIPPRDHLRCSLGAPFPGEGHLSPGLILIDGC